ncbi:MAG: HEAT repeat domain-containing protein [Chloroflexi bacterium]|nr:HEAT repeat domain-containing protein [Chloroflexota bacterium]
MRFIKYILIIIACALILPFLSNMDIRFPQKSKYTIPTDIPVEVREQLERLSTRHRGSQYEAVQKLCDKDPDPAPAAAFLILMLGDDDENIRYGAMEVLESIGSSVSDNLIKALGDKNPYTRASAARVLGRIKEQKSVLYLIKALRDENQDVRKTAVRSLGQINDEKAVPYIINTLGDENYDVRWAAKNVLSDMGKSILGDLNEALADENPQVRESSAEIIGGYKDKESVPYLIKALKDGNREVREAAAKSLGQIKDESAVPALVEMFLTDMSEMNPDEACYALRSISDEKAIPLLYNGAKSGDKHTRYKAILALGELRDKRTIPFLARLIQDSDLETRRDAAWALSKLKAPETIPLLEGLLEDKNTPDKTGMGSLLGKIGAPAVPVLIKALKSDEILIRREAASGFCEVRPIDERGYEPLAEALKVDQDEVVRSYAASCLRYYGNKGAASYLIDALKDRSNLVRYVAAYSLGDTGDKTAIPYLMKSIKDPDKTVRRASARSLGDLNAVEAVPLLMIASNDTDEDVRREAKGSLKRIKYEPFKRTSRDKKKSSPPDKKSNQRASSHGNDKLTSVDLKGKQSDQKGQKAIVKQEIYGQKGDNQAVDNAERKETKVKGTTSSPQASTKRTLVFLTVVIEDGIYKDKEMNIPLKDDEQINKVGYVLDDDGCNEEYLFYINDKEYRSELPPVIKINK